jgi:aminoglycoside phosphotransferase family enzyme
MVYKARIPGENASVRHSTTKSFPKEASSKKHSVASPPRITEPLSREISSKKQFATSPTRITEPLSKGISPEGSLITFCTHSTEPLSKSSPCERRSEPQSNRNSVLHCYKIEDMRQSETAWVLFTRHMTTKQCFVMKILKEYKDTRYSLEDVNERQQCQLEALHWNRIFTPGIYLGLGCIHDLDLYRKLVSLEEIIRNPTKERLDPYSDYALIMHQLPSDRRLDCILSEESASYCKLYIKALVRRISEIHEDLTPMSIEEGRRWACYEHLEEKLMHNIELAIPILDVSNTTSRGYFSEMRNTFIQLRDQLLHVFAYYPYQRFFEQRIQQQGIKRCHGDLKSPNILIAPYKPWDDGDLWRRIWILDAIDFNPSYSNIDVLSDLAMLIIDVQVRMKTPRLADFMIDEYLSLTKQQGEVSRFVLSYYLVEKAFVGAAISIVYDNLPDLGWGYLEAAKMRMEDLKRWTTI